MTGTEVTTRAPTPPPAGPSGPRPRPRRRMAALLAAVALAAAGVGIGLGVSLGGGSSGPTGSADPMYGYYRSVMGRYPGSMMGGSMMGSYGYGWMMGGPNAPRWMAGGSLPPAMMGGGTDPGQVMGRLWADAPGPRVSPADATRLGDEHPAGANVDPAAKSIVFSGDAHLAILAGPPGGPDETFRAAGLTNPAITVPVGAAVTIELINADPDTAHGAVVTASDATSSWMPMMTAAPAFPGSALWFLGNPTSAGMHAGTMTFTAATAGTYHYLCPVPGHAQKGMIATFQVR